MQATQVGNLIRSFGANLAPSSEIETIGKFLPQVSADIALELKSTMNILKQQPALDTLQAQQEIWQERRSQLTGWLKVLTDRATKLQAALAQLKKLQDTWSKTRAEEESGKAPAPILQQIDATLAGPVLLILAILISTFGCDWPEPPKSDASMNRWHGTASIKTSSPNNVPR